MVIKPLLTSIRSATEGDRQGLANLLHFETLVHRHLDWRPPLEWIGYSPYLIAERNGELVAALACPPDPPQVAWIRLFAISSVFPAARAWQELWPEARKMLVNASEARVAAVIPLQRWFRNLLDRGDFTFTHSVQVLTWANGEVPPSRQADKIWIRPMMDEDLLAVEAVDRSAFGPIWQNSYSGLELAYLQSAVSTVAETDGRIIGYQISTATPMGGHLARLAVHPDFQGKGIGYDLVQDLLAQFKRRGALSVTVNTQHNNTTSLSLYHKTGFRPTGEEYPVYQQTIR